jgi:DNA (cytosine-5)-methyltransferase 1
MSRKDIIPVIDLFAGPGGLGEGFSSLRTSENRPVFRIRLSIEMDEFAHRTLELRAFFRNFPKGQAPEQYYDYLRGKLSHKQLFEAFPDEAKEASQEAWHAELGSPHTPKREIDDRVSTALAGRDNWVLIGGPPCQIYSLVGRSRVLGSKNGKRKYEDDPKHGLYRRYLRVIAKHKPPVFVMENVKGLLSAKIKGESIFERILEDLKSPGQGSDDPDLEYRLVSLVQRADEGSPEPREFVVCSEKYGVPQARHRIMILGIRSDIDRRHRLLRRSRLATVAEAIGDLPRLRSGISKNSDSAVLWQEAIRKLTGQHWIRNGAISRSMRQALRSACRRVGTSLDRGAEFVPCKPDPAFKSDWFLDRRLDGVCNHAARSHIPPDLQRYFFAAVFAREMGRSPLLEHFPRPLLPSHENVKLALKETKFNDRFRVQLRNRPSTTVVSHIAKDGHYFIHYDPSQARSLTVREAARLQTFPDNYLFEGPRTEQYKQVGNAVPPLLAKQISEIVAQLLNG